VSRKPRFPYNGRQQNSDAGKLRRIDEIPGRIFQQDKIKTNRRNRFRNSYNSFQNLSGVFLLGKD